MKSVKIALCCLALGFMTVACEDGMEEMDTNMAVNAVSQHVVTDSRASQFDTLITLKKSSDLKLVSENLRDLFVVNNAVEKTDCGPTEFVTVQNKYIGMLGNELVPALGGFNANYLFALYLNINFVSAYFDRSEQYFGEKGEYTSLINKRKRELEKFWQMPGQIRVNGQHNATLNDRDKVANTLFSYFTGFPTKGAAYAYADMLIETNAAMTTLPESPFFSVDGFASSDNLIVIGDGLVKMISEAGVQEDIAWVGVLAHEWAHQIQFDNSSHWYPNGAADNITEASRNTELEADFMASYYMTHKRGATYNWKRVEQFFNLFFQIGDCGFESNSHHGTPLQRMAAAQMGYDIARKEQKQGHIMTPQQLHDIYVANMNTLL